MAQQLGQVEAGTLVTMQESSGPAEFYILHQGPYIDGETQAELVDRYSGFENKTVLVRKYLPSKQQYSTSTKSADFSKSVVLSWLTETYVPSLPMSIQELLREVTIPYRYGLYDGDNGIDTITTSVYLPDYEELRDIFSARAEMAATYDGVATIYWQRGSEYYSSNTVYAQYIGTDGSQNRRNPTSSYGVRPVLVLDSTLAYVTDDGEVVANTPPEITGTDGDIGTFGETSPTYAYTVTDPQGGTVSVTEALDGETLRTYTVTLGQQNTLTIPAATYLTTLNGTHTLTITATDSVGASTVRTLTFTKNVTSCAFTQTTAFTVDDMPTRCVVNIQGAFPEGSVLTVQICNNGNDASPTWETITQQALLGQKYFFQNETKTAANWGVKVQASLSRGTAEGDCYISSIGGVFQ